MSKQQPPAPEGAKETELPAEVGATGEIRKAPRIRGRWVALSIIANVALIGVIMIAAGAGIVLHQSDTNPQFCASCHVMQANVESYLTSNHLDNVHMQAGVECKDCHSDYTIPDEIASGVSYVTGNYVVDETTGGLAKRDFGDAICEQCHGTRADMEVKTDYLFYNPHGDQMGVFECSLCHTSHGEQRDYCNECHEAPGQRILGDTSTRSEQIGKPEDLYNMYGG